jgi:hypothetical protein
LRCKFADLIKRSVPGPNGTLGVDVCLQRGQICFFPIIARSNHYLGNGGGRLPEFVKIV